MVNVSILPLRLEGAVVQKRGKTILDGISLTLEPTGLTIVMGPNGAGKTTLLRQMHGLERQKSGLLNWNCSNEDARSRQAFVFQTPVMMRRSVLDNIAYPLTVRGSGKSEARREAADWGRNVGLGEALQLAASNLSGGERQKLAIARALISKPEVLFLDEPTTNLDGKSTREIEAILQSAHNNGTRMIMTTHDIGQARRLATDIVFLNQGKLSEHSLADTFYKTAHSAAARAYLNGEILE